VVAGRFGPLRASGLGAEIASGVAPAKTTQADRISRPKRILDHRPDVDDHPALRVVQPDETIHVQAPAGDALVLVTDRRLAVANAERLMLDVPIEGLRRIQFDIERRRPATLVIVPEEREYEPQVLAIEPSGFEAIARALVTVGLRFAAAADQEKTG
jgi:hypothetical protein